MTQWSRNRAMAAAIIAFMLTIAAIQLYVRPETSEERAEVVRTILQLVGGSVLLAGIYLTYRTVRSAEETVKQSVRTAESAEETVRLSTLQEQNERFARSVELLGSSQIAVRVGAVYSLEHLAGESDSYCVVVTDLLADFVRDARHILKSRPEEWIGADIQAALTVLGRRHRPFAGTEKDRLDLSFTNLRGAKLSLAQLEGAKFYKTNLRDAELIAAKCSRTVFWDADLRGAHLEAADLRYAWFTSANLSGAGFFNPYPNSAQRDLSPEATQAIEEHQMRLFGKITPMTGDKTDSALSDQLILADFEGAILMGTKFRVCDLRAVKNLTSEQIAVAELDDLTLLPRNISDPRIEG